MRMIRVKRIREGQLSGTTAYSPYRPLAASQEFPSKAVTPDGFLPPRRIANASGIFDVVVVNDDFLKVA